MIIQKLAEMEYTGNYGSYILLAKGEYKGHLFAVVNRGSHPCCYIRINGSVDTSIFEHEITYIGSFVPQYYERGEGFYESEDGTWLGWDHAHAGDFIAMVWHLKPLACEHVYTTNEMIQECIEAIDALEEETK